MTDIGVLVAKEDEKVKLTSIEFGDIISHDLLPTPKPDITILQELKVATVLVSDTLIEVGKSNFMLGDCVKGWPNVRENVYEDKSPIVDIDMARDA